MVYRFLAGFPKWVAKQWHLCAQRHSRHTAAVRLVAAGDSCRPGKPTHWKRDAELMAWLDSL
jgi:hypothetical protein